jgi:hypothetical protein
MMESSITGLTRQPPTVDKVENVRYEEVFSSAIFPRTDQNPISFEIPQRQDE